jgi:hypothetical protein
MPVRLGRGTFLLIDGSAVDDFEAIASGVITEVPQIIGNSGCVLEVGTFEPREG